MSALVFTSLLPQFGQTERELLQLIADQHRTREGTALASAARTVLTSSSIITNPDCSNLVIFLNITAVPGLGGIRQFLKMIDPVSAAEQDVWPVASSPLRTAAGCYIYQVGPAMQASPSALNANHTVFASQVPRQFKVYVEPTTADSYTYSVGYALIP